MNDTVLNASRDSIRRGSTSFAAAADFKLSTILAPLEPYKKYVSSFGNLQNAATAGSASTRSWPRAS